MTTATLTKTSEKAAPKSRRLTLIVDEPVTLEMTHEPAKSRPERRAAAKLAVASKSVANTVAEYVEFRGVNHLTVATGTDRKTFCGKSIPKSAKFGDETINGIAATCEPCRASFAPKPATPTTPAVDVAAMDQVTRLNVAKKEAAAKKAWKLAGSTGDAPATPVIDWMNGTPRNERKTRKTGDGSTKRYDATVTAELIERVTTARATGISFPKLAVALNEEGYHGAGWTGPKLYALACRHNVGKLPLIKSVEPKPAKAVKAAAAPKATEPKKATKAPTTKSLAEVLPKTRKTGLTPAGNAAAAKRFAKK